MRTVLAARQRASRGPCLLKFGASSPVRWAAGALLNVSSEARRRDDDDSSFAVYSPWSVLQSSCGVHLKSADPWSKHIGPRHSFSSRVARLTHGSITIGSQHRAICSKHSDKAQVSWNRGQRVPLCAVDVTQADLAKSRSPQPLKRGDPPYRSKMPSL